jgi:hypothetical protein
MIDNTEPLNSSAFAVFCFWLFVFCVGGVVNCTVIVLRLSLPTSSFYRKSSHLCHYPMLLFRVAMKMI